MHRVPHEDAISCTEVAWLLRANSNPLLKMLGTSTDHCFSGMNRTAFRDWYVVALSYEMMFVSAL